ncbi:MAG TPA: hypothetical protein VKK61_02000, partial [Tepidisphaeraceae bacterium]|nr:hypothetical protein [Tepidisphaeraceae bacterium]
GDGSTLYDGANSTFGPPPGYLVGGANQFYDVPSVAPPSGQPPEKSFKDFNTGWDGTKSENSWEVTEPDLGYQAAFEILLAQFATDVAPMPHAVSGNYPWAAAPNQVQFTFDQSMDPTSFQVGDLVLTNPDGGAVPAVQSVSYNESTKTATFLLAVGANGLLANGNYAATLSSGSVTSTVGKATTAALTVNFFSLAGDLDHDRDVDNADFATFFSNFGKPSGATFSQGDLDYDGDVDNADFAIFFSNFGKVLAPPSQQTATTFATASTTTTIAPAINNSPAPIKTTTTRKLPPTHVWQQIEPTTRNLWS